MSNPRQHPTRSFGNIRRATGVGLALGILFGLSVFASQTAQAQTYSVIYNFTGGNDGAQPSSTLVSDEVENFYGTATYGGAGHGTVFKLTHSASGWVLSTLYSFAAGNDGEGPAGVVIGPDGTLYGVTDFGGGYNNCISDPRQGCGTVFNLRPSLTGPWIETVLYRFTGGNDGGEPYHPQPVFDQAGSIYGTTWLGGKYGNCLEGHHCGTVSKLTPSGGGWDESVIWNFGQSGDGVEPVNGVIFGPDGDLYGTTSGGGQDGRGSFCSQGVFGTATVYRLTPSGSNWTEDILYTFPPSGGALVYSGLVFDQSGNLYGAGCNGGLSGSSGGFAFELTPSGGSWTYSDLYNFGGGPGDGPLENLIMDSSGNIYGTTRADGAYGHGSVFKLTHNSDGTWTYTSLHDFTGGSDGGEPWSKLLFHVAWDANGKTYIALFGTATRGGTYNSGVVFEITP